jgi:hypothetical protein
MNEGMLTIEESRYGNKAAEGGEYVKQDNRMRLLLNCHVGFQVRNMFVGCHLIILLK